ncbi:MAG: deoxyribose-phosphate aldolase, partial [bacterium]
MNSGAVRISASRGVGKVADDLALKIDHTLLKPEATEKQVENLCAEASEYGFCSVCVNPWFVPLCAKLLRRSGVKVCTVIGFPLGATTPETKAYETRDVIGEGAQECDMVINVGA